MKSYTDIHQSKKLVSILPIESADMHSEAIEIDGDMVFIVVSGLGDKTKSNYGSPVWSLAALLTVIPSGQVNRVANSDKWEASSWNNSGFEPAYYVEDYNNPVDACYEMILKLHEQKLL